MTVAALDRLPAGAVCEVHPARAAQAVCARCGSFACGACRVERDGAAYCGRCVDLISPLADPALRLLAYLVDSFVLMPPVIAIAYGVMARETARALALSAIGGGTIAVVLALNAVWVHRHGQSIGKRMCRLRVVAIDGGRVGLWRILLLRNALPLALSMIPFAGTLFTILDPFFIFGSNRRTLHDLIAGSIVVSVRNR